jgi:hypothetical protein
MVTTERTTQISMTRQTTELVTTEDTIMSTLESIPELFEAEVIVLLLLYYCLLLYMM